MIVTSLVKPIIMNSLYLVFSACITQYVAGLASKNEPKK